VTASLIDDDALDELERELIARVRGRVLEIGAGDGENFGAFDPDVEWIGLEPDATRRAELATRAREWRHASTPLDARAEAIPLPDASVDAVVGTYVLCSVGDPAAALAEVRRVLVPGGRVIFVDHVIAPPGTLKRAVQRVATPISKRVCHGCHWDRDTERTLAEAGFVGSDIRRLRVRSMPFGPVPMLLYDGRSPDAGAAGAGSDEVPGAGAGAGPTAAPE
jgi:ubiquinone/menaquinone biosynthesis C-methylase UbiE